jgi:ribosomal protein S18 acetylase RimI-like enzyme
MTTGIAVTVTVARLGRAGYTRGMRPADSASAPSLHQATPQEAAACYDILRSYGESVDPTLGIVSWAHPRAEAFVHADAAAGRLYVVRQNGALAATFAILGEGAPRFSAVRWAEPGARAAYLHRLAVVEAFRGAGLGKWSMAQGERIATEEGYDYLRLDALPTEVRAMNFYRLLGYTNCGTITVESGDPRQPLVDLVCFEKRLSGAGAGAVGARAGRRADSPAAG